MPTLPTSSFARLVAPSKIFVANATMTYQDIQIPPRKTNTLHSGKMSHFFNHFPTLQNVKKHPKKMNPNLSQSSSRNSWVEFARFHDPPKGMPFFLGHLHGVWINNACIAFKVLHIGTILGKLNLLYTRNVK